MIFGPIYLALSVEIGFHALILFGMLFKSDILDQRDVKEWAMAAEGILDMIVQFYMYFMAPI